MALELTYYAFRWPGGEPPAEAPLWSYYEVDRRGDAVLRMVQVFRDGKVGRNSLEIERRNGRDWSSLISTSVEDGFDGAELVELSGEDFERHWRRGTPAR